MANEIVEQVVVRAVQQAYDAWAAEHPSLAAVIDQISLTERSVESLRNSDSYRQAVAKYQQSRSELELLQSMLELAGPIVSSILGY